MTKTVIWSLAMDPTRWESVVGAAAKAFAHFGFRKTSMEDVARAAGVAKGTLYLGCSSKRDLFYQTIFRDLRRWNAELALLIDPTRPADELLFEVAQQAFLTQERFPLARGMILGEFEQDLPDWAEHVGELRAHGEHTILEILRLGVLQGRFRADLDLEPLAGILLDVIAATLMFHARDGRLDDGVLRRAQAISDLVLHGIAAGD